MTRFDMRSLTALAAVAVLTACGGGTEPAEQQASFAPMMVQSAAPLADCEAEGCNRPRIIDGLAEQSRAAAMAQQQAQQAQPAHDTALAAESGAQLPAAPPGQPDLSAALPAAGGQPE